MKVAPSVSPKVSLRNPFSLAVGFFLSQFYQKGGVFSLKNPLKPILLSNYFGAKVEFYNQIPVELFTLNDYFSNMKAWELNPDLIFFWYKLYTYFQKL